jgi:Domain of unknown function (DUF4129)
MNRPSPARRWLPVFAVCGLLGVAWLASSMSSLDVAQLPPLEGTPLTPAEPTSSSPAPQASPVVIGGGGSGYTLPGWVTVAAAVLCVLASLTVVGGLVILLLRSWAARERPLVVEKRAPDQLTPRAVAGDVVAAVDAGLAELSDVDSDPRRAVIACWVRLEHAAAVAGTHRHVGDSPTDLVTRLLAAHQVSRPVLDGFAGVYREARYATHPIGERSRQTALTALRHLRAELAKPVSVSAAEAEAGHG